MPNAPSLPATAQEYRWWLGICRMLDRRMAETVAAHREAANLR
jgi:hypothetical protein